MFVIGGIQKTTLLDFPEKVAAIVFTQGCNFRCGYCHNPELLSYPPFEGESKFLTSGRGKSEKDFLSFLKTRIGKLDGVVITGGEPTLQSGLYDFVKEIKSLGFAVKLDTNGTNPNILERLLKDDLLDYIAMDIKAPFEKYCEITGVNIDIKKIKKSIELIINSSVDYEFRTTVLKSQLSIEDFDKIGKMMKGAKKYYLQKFIASKIYNTNLKNAEVYTDEELHSICDTLSNYISFVNYR